MALLIPSGLVDSTDTVLLPAGLIEGQGAAPPEPAEEKPRPETYRYLHMLIR